MFVLKIKFELNCFICELLYIAIGPDIIYSVLCMGE